MTMLSRYFKPFITEMPKTTPNTSRKNRHHLQVSISSEPPTILYIQQSKDEQECECIFDPLVQHDEEKDHPDLFASKKQNELKPWQKPPYCKAPTSHHGTFFKRMVSNMRMKSPSSSSSSSPSTSTYTPCFIE